jgi:hypothetical protein
MLSSPSRRHVQASIRVALTALVVALYAVLPAVAQTAGPLAPAAHGKATTSTAKAPGIYLNGPRTVSLNTPYTYQVEVVSAKSYKRAVIEYYVPTEGQGTLIRRITNLTAHKPWVGKYPTEFNYPFKPNPDLVGSDGVGVIVVAKTKRRPHGQTIYSKDFPLALAPGPQPSPSQNNEGKSPQMPPLRLRSAKAEAHSPVSQEAYLHPGLPCGLPARQACEPGGRW